jgi:hypothetical protein
MLGCCLLPYLVSSIYSLAGALLQMPTESQWLWGDWLSTLVTTDSGLYVVLAEGPILCVGALALLIIVMGLMAMLTGQTRAEELLLEEEDEFDETYESEWE